MERNGDLYERIPGRDRLMRMRREQDEVQIFDGPEIPNLPGTSIPIVDPATRRKLVKSAFHITVSSNVRGARLLEYARGEVGQALNVTCNWLFGQSYKDNPRFYNILSLVDGTKHNTRNTGERPAAGDIHSIKWTNNGVDGGSHAKGSRIHLHGTLEVLHYTKLRVDQRKCQEYLNNMLTFGRNQNVDPSPPEIFRRRREEIKGVFVNAQHLGRDAQSLFLYGQKEIAKRIIRELNE